MSDWLIKSEDLAAAAKVTLRQLQWWAEQKVVTPTIDAHRRLYTAEQAVQVVVIAELRRFDVGLFYIRKHKRSLKAELCRQSANLASSYLAFHMLKGTTIVSAHPQAALAASKRSGWCVIDIGNLVARLPQSPLADPSKAA